MTLPQAQSREGKVTQWPSQAKSQAKVGGHFNKLSACRQDMRKTKCTKSFHSRSFINIYVFFFLSFLRAFLILKWRRQKWNGMSDFQTLAKRTCTDTNLQTGYCFDFSAGSCIIHATLSSICLLFFFFFFPFFFQLVDLCLNLQHLLVIHYIHYNY